MYKNRKEIVIVIAGSKYISSRAKLTQHLIIFLYGLTRVLKPVYHNYAREWTNEFKAEDREVMWLRWNRGFTIFSRWFGIRRLKHVIRHYDKKHDIKLIGISLGGDIALEAAKSFDDGTIKKIVLICSTNTTTQLDYKNIKVVNIFSPYDIFAKIAAKVLAPIHGGIILQGKNVKNIPIENFSHDEFCANKKIKSGKYKGWTITRLINQLL
jgi:pimeloyl-ACP methyl ester carboxylesterase